MLYTLEKGLKPQATLWACCPRLLPIPQLPNPHPGTDLEAGDGETPSIVRERGHRHHEGAVRDVFVVELDGDLIVP